jgi:O-methyltransferase involved in polyketide biosynthesis
MSDRDNSGAIRTAYDSIDCKYQSSVLRYFEDRNLAKIHEELVKNGLTTKKRPPIINKGYYLRVSIFQIMMSKFIECWKDHIEGCQLVYLGCGYDSTPLNYSSSGRNIRVYEVDFQEVTRRKTEIYNTIVGTSGSAFEQNSDKSVSQYKALNHSLITGDLNDVDTLINLLTAQNMDFSIPTLIITECVLPYLSPDSIFGLISRFSSLFQRIAWISYDMFNLQDNFGKVMIRNITGSGVPLPGATVFPSKNDEINFFLSHGWDSCHCSSLLELYNNEISAETKRRMSGIEQLDEIEEWNLILHHYSFFVASKGMQLELKFS